MPIEKLPEFAKDGQKNTDELDLETGFIVNRKPARQWFNWLFNTLTLKINEIIDGKIDGSSIVDDLTTDDATKPVSAKQAKNLQDNKLDKTENAVSATKLKTTRTISFSGGATGSFNFNGSADTSFVLTLANSGATAGTYGSTLKIPVITVNAEGLITTATTQDIPTASTTAKGLVELATSAEVLSGTDTTRAITPAALLSLFTATLTGNTAARFTIPNNSDPTRPFIVQIGHITATSGSMITFPVAFPNNLIAVLVGDYVGNHAAGYIKADSTKTAFKLNAAVSTYAANWIAIGN